METQTSKETLSGDVLKAKLREALIAIKKLKKEVADHTGVGHEDIAIVGMACRFPGGIKDLKGYWDLLEGAKNVITEIPKQRWDNDYFYQEEEKKEGKINTKYGGFIDDVELFDNTYFGISPIEAKYMDPQQRLLLEVTCETLEHAGINIQSLQGSDTGVFVGSAANDYSRKHLNSPNNHDISAYSITGGELYAIPGRISYILGLQGPSSLVSTACSSSLVAIHQACQSLLLRESNLALAGGSNLMISPEPYIALSQMGALSVDGQCKAFDAKANGYVRGEGVGMVALKRLSDAEKDGDEILAVIKATAVNQDGKSNGFTAPNVKAQEKLIETALAKCGLDISQIDLIEAHGTGTPLGDPIELQAITNVIKRSAQKREKPLLIGTVKSNFGHTEGAAGVAGLIKMVLAIQHQKVPQSLHFETPNPYYKWDENHIKVPQKTLDWQKDSARVGGISSFGVSGTNAHAIVAEYVPTAAESLPTPETGIHLLPISANSFEAIQAYAAKYAAHFEGIAEKEIYHHTASALYNRTQLKNRVVLAASSKDSLMHKLKELAADRLTIFTAIDAEKGL
ncbi:MAG: type I polyketide synthase [Flammeovirgaceae bacterium]